MPSRSLKIPIKSDLERRILGRLASRINFAERGANTRWEKWRKAEDLILAYLPEQTEDAVRRSRRENGGRPQYTTMMVPYTYAVLMAAHTYMTSVFFSRNPVHQFAGRHGETEQQTQALEALIDYQVDVGQMMAPYYIWFYDSLKYGAGIIGEYWCQETLHVGQIVEIPKIDPETGMASETDWDLVQTTIDIPGYHGNKIYNVNPYLFLHDPRVPLARFQEGEFCGSMVKISWPQIKARVEAGYYLKDRLDILKHHESRQPQNWSSQLERPLDESFSIYEGEEPTGKKINHPAIMNFYELFVKIIPKEWGLGPSEKSELWVFTLSQDKTVLLGASPFSFWHATFPFSVLESEVEGYGLYNRGVPEIMEPIQNTMDWLVNSHFYNVRAALNNQFILDPSKIIARDGQDGGPGFRYRLRPEAYGTDVRQAFMQVPVNDVTRMHMSDLQQMFGIGERVLGVNDQILGMLATGGRKTATEVRTSTGFGTNRLKTMCEYASVQGFSPHSQRLVQQSQQYYDAPTKLRVVGDLAVGAGPQFLTVTPDDVAGYYSFVNVDGTLPVDRMAQANLWKEILGNFRNMPPQIAMEYDFGRIFGWAAQLGGLKNINQFKIQVLPPGVAPTGNVVPIMSGNRGRPTGVEPGNSASGAAGLPQLVQ